MPDAHGAPVGALREAAPRGAAAVALTGYVRTVGAIAEVELHRLRREPIVLLTRLAQPLLWLLVFGSAVSSVRDLGAAGTDYKAFIVPGVIAQSMLFIAIFSGIAIIWERDLGITQRIVVAPVAHSAIVVGKAAGAGVRAIVLALLVLVVVALAGIPIDWSPLGVIGAMLVTGLGAMLFSSISMVIAAAVRSREQFMGLGQLITLPLFFASNALYQVRLMPSWLETVAWANPLTYEVELLRRLLLGIGPDRVLRDLAVLLGASLVAIAAAARLYPRRVL